MILKIMKANQTLFDITGGAMAGLREVFQEVRPDMVHRAPRHDYQHRLRPLLHFTWVFRFAALRPDCAVSM
jgi:hypothetical protein